MFKHESVACQMKRLQSDIRKQVLVILDLSFMQFFFGVRPRTQASTDMTRDIYGCQNVEITNEIKYTYKKNFKSILIGKFTKIIMEKYKTFGSSPVLSKTITFSRFIVACILVAIVEFCGTIAMSLVSFVIFTIILVSLLALKKKKSWNCADQILGNIHIFFACLVWPLPAT